MIRHQGEANGSSDDHGNLITLAILALIVGAFAGILGGLFRLSLVHADFCAINSSHGLMPEASWASSSSLRCSQCWSRSQHGWCAASRRVHPEAEFRMSKQRWHGACALRVPCVSSRSSSQAACSRSAPALHWAAKDRPCRWAAAPDISSRELTGRSWPDTRTLIAAGAGAGLATAFNAPLAGAIFVLEELYKRFEVSIATAALGASATAIAVSRLILGDAADFQVAPIPFVTDEVKPLFFALGLLSGFLAVIYNSMLLGALSIGDRLAHIPWSCAPALSARRSA